MKIDLTLIFLLLAICSCNETQKANSPGLKHQDDHLNQLEQTSATVEENLTATSEVCDFSNEMIEFIKLLQQDDYNIDSSMTDDTLKFEIREELKIVKSYTFLPHEYKLIYAKRYTALEGKEETWYPNFRVYEICFDTERLAIDYEIKLSEVLSSPDIFNEKNYDYLIQHHNRIIYVTCGAKIFEQYAFQYRDIIKKIIRN